MRAGDIFQVDFGDPVGSEPGFVRPALIVTSDLILDRNPKIIHVVPITSNIGQALPTEILLDDVALPKASAAQVHLCTAVSPDRFTSARQGNVGPATLAQVRSILADLLDIP